MRFIAFFIILILITPLHAKEFKIDPVHSHVGFKIRYMMLTSIRGHFKTFNGKAIFDSEGNVNQISGIIDVASVDTLNKKRDAHLKSDSFFNVGLYPSIKFKTIKVIKDGDDFIALGQLEIHGIKRTVSIPFKLSDPIIDNIGKERIGLEGHIRINRKEFGIMYSEKMDNGGHIVDDHVDLELNVQLVKSS